MKTLFPSSAFVGFDHLFNELEWTAKHAQDHYPPHNIIKTSEEDYLIEIAVAGFNKEGIEVEYRPANAYYYWSSIKSKVVITFTVEFPLRSLSEPFDCLRT